MWRVSTLAVTLLCLRLSGSEDLYWRPNTDWSNPSNWALGRAPCEGDVADLSLVPRGSFIKLDGNTTVRSVVLPVGSTLFLGSSISLRLSNSTTCEVQTASVPMVAEVDGEENTFVGAGPNYWECPENWRLKDGMPPESAPCGQDKAIFEEGHYYSSVESNASVSVQSLEVRGQPFTTKLIPSIAREFKLNLSVVSACGEDPSLCPCLTNCLAPEPTPTKGPPTMEPPTKESPTKEPPTKESPTKDPPTKESPTKEPPTKEPSSAGAKRSNTSGRTAGIVIAVLVLVLMVVALTVLVIVLWLRWRRKNGSTPYMKDDLIGEPDDNIHSPGRSGGREGALFGNPIYELDVAGSDIKKPMGSGISQESDAAKAHEMETIAILKPSDYEPVGYTVASDAPEDAPSEDSKKAVPVLNEYERLS